MSNAHEVLGISRTATRSEVKKAYHKMCLIYHPDVGGDEKKFLKIKEAYDELNVFNPNKTHNIHVDNKCRPFEIRILRESYDKGSGVITQHFFVYNITNAFTTNYEYSWNVGASSFLQVKIPLKFSRKNNFKYKIHFLTVDGFTHSIEFSFKDPRSKLRKLWDRLFN